VANFRYTQNTIFLIYVQILKIMKYIISLIINELGEIYGKMEKYDLVAPCGDYCGAVDSIMD